MKLTVWCLVSLIGMLAIFPVGASCHALSPERIVHELSSNQETSQAQALASQLGLTSGSSNRTCGEFSGVSSKSLWSDNVGHVVAVEAYSETCIEKFLIILQGARSHWRHAGTIALEEHYTTPEYKVTPLFMGQAPGIVVTNNVVDSGTGISQENFQIFAFIGSALRLVFDRPEKVALAVPFRAKGRPAQYVNTQTSTFDIIQPTRQSPTASIEETRRITVNGRSVTEYRKFVWNPRWQTFYSVALAPSP